MLPGRHARERSGKTARDEQKERTRQRIYEAAKALFKEKGYMQTRSADIAKAAGVSQGAVHAHFPGKADILSALMVDYLEHVDAEMARIDVGSLDVFAALQVAILRVAEIHTENIDQVSWYYGYAWIWENAEEREYRRLMDRIRRRFFKVVQDGIGRGELREETPIELIVDLLRGYYRAHLRRLRFGDEKPEDFVQRLGPCIELLLGQYRRNQA